MQINKILFSLFSIVLLFVSCDKQDIDFVNNTIILSPTEVGPLSANKFPESFDAGTKIDFTAEDISLPTGMWRLEDALLGSTAADVKFGSKSVRIQNNGTLTMNFDIPNGATSVSLYYAKYGAEVNSSFQLWSSVNAGSTWQQVGGDITASTSTLTKATFITPFPGLVRFQVRKISGGILNIDFMDIQENPPAAIDNNMALGNPSAAIANISYPDNYLMVKHQFVLSYNSSKGTANWVSWNVSPEWNGTASRCDCFEPDNKLPAGFFMAYTTDYSNTGFDRGHQCPSADRDKTNADNAATFLMTNIIPQAPNLNQVTWANIENYCRTLINNGNELYVISGGSGAGGTGSLGGVTSSISLGRITVPSHCWKVIVILPLGTNDATRVTTSTRVITVYMPNTQTVSSQPWGNYRLSVDALESILGYNFLSNVPVSIQNVIETNVDNGPTQ
ncbi:MAG: DNA/RNA non-specific endonuclease [Chitinophagaceae bacterium]|nr:DNA/RNA non-specific endonuclease [Chitinophagaceae bacterium]